MIKSSGCALAAVLLCLSTAAQALEYSADAIFHGRKGTTTTNKLKVYVSGQKVRIQPIKGTPYDIFDLAKQAGWFVLPGKPTRVLPDPRAAIRDARYHVEPSPCAKLFITEAPTACKKVGADTIDGRAAEKWQFGRTDHGKNIVWTAWIDRSLDAVVKVQREQVAFELLNVHFGPQPNELFVVPTVPAVLPQKQSPPQK
jgi:hypothetical protein